MLLTLFSELSVFVVDMRDCTNFLDLTSALAFSKIFSFVCLPFEELKNPFFEMLENYDNNELK